MILAVLFLIIGGLNVMNVLNDDQPQSSPVEADFTESRSTKPALAESASGIGAEKTPATQSQKLPAFKIIEEVPYDAPIKTQIEYRVVLSESTDEPGLRLLLEHLLKTGQARRGFKFHDGRPTHVFAYVYPTVEHSGAQWLGMVSQIGKNATPSFSIKSELVGKSSAPELKFGLTLDQRKEVFRQAFLIDDESMKRAEAKFPLPTGRGVDPASAREMISKQADEQDKIRAELRAPILKKYAIDTDAFYDIVVEGAAENWPQP